MISANVKTRREARDGLIKKLIAQYNIKGAVINNYVRHSILTGTSKNFRGQKIEIKIEYGKARVIK